MAKPDSFKSPPNIVSGSSSSNNTLEKFAQSHNARTRLDRALVRSLPSRSASLCAQSEIWYNTLLEYIKFPFNYIFQKQECYTLEEVCKAEIIEDISSESLLLDWIKTNFQDFISDTNKLINQFNIVETFAGLVPFVTSNKIKPDVALLSKDCLPLLLFEVDSSDYRGTIVKSVASLIFQFRLLTNCDNNISSICGFVFPKRKQAKPVTKITLEWKNLCFTTVYEYLNKEKVESEIKEVLERQCKFTLSTGSSLDYFLRVSKSDLVLLQNWVGSETELTQVESAYSILVKNDTSYFKIIPPVDQNSKMLALHIKTLENVNGKNFPYLVLPIKLYTVPHSGVNIFKYESQFYKPLTFNEAFACLGDFVTEAIKGLKECHVFGYAHKDVRLPNICFSRDHELRLIDFDLAKPVDSKYVCNDDRYFNCPPEARMTYQGLDFKQLGLTVSEVIMIGFDKRMNSDDIVSDPFLQELIIGGTYSEAALKVFSKNYGKTIKEVLLSRPTT